MELATVARGASTRTPGRTSIVAGLLVCAAAFGVYLSSSVRLETDSYWTVYTARSLVAHGDVNLDEYRDRIAQRLHFQIDTINGHEYYSVPLAVSLVAVPAVMVASAVDPAGLDRRLAEGHPGMTENITAAAITSLAVLLVFLVTRRLTTRLWVAVASSLTFAFGTQAWSTASRTMWMHGPSMVCIAAALYFALRTRQSPKWFGAVGAVLMVGYFVRPTNAVPLVAFGVWSLVEGRRPLLRYVVAAATVAATFFALDLWFYGRLLQPYFRSSRLALSSRAIEAMAGNLVSPGRGLVVFVPAILVCGYGVLAKLRRGALASLDVTVLITVVAYWAGVSLFPHWWGGWAYGPRLLSDVAPLVVWFLPAAIDDIVDRRRQALAIGAVVLVAASIGIQAAGSLDERTAAWNWTPNDIDRVPARVWDWTHPQFLP